MELQVFNRKMLRLIARSHNTGLILRRIDWRGDGAMLLEFQWAPGKNAYICAAHPADYKQGENNFTFTDSTHEDCPALTTLLRLCRLAQDVANQVIIQHRELPW